MEAVVEIGQMVQVLPVVLGVVLDLSQTHQAQEQFRVEQEHLDKEMLAVLSLIILALVLGVVEQEVLVVV
jgi:hypothetical protein